MHLKFNLLGLAVPYSDINIYPGAPCLSHPKAPSCGCLATTAAPTIKPSTEAKSTKEKAKKLDRSLQAKSGL